MRTLSKLTVLLAFSTALIGQIVINEIHYNPSSAQGNDDVYEFLELYNAGTSSEDLSNWTVGATDASNLASLSGVTMAAGDYVVVAYNDSAYTGKGYTVVDAGGYFGLGNSGKILQLKDGTGTVVDEVTYDDADPWPNEPDGAGPSLELINPGLDNNSSSNWGISQANGGTPGAQNSIYTDVNLDAPQFGTITVTPAAPNETQIASICAVITDDVSVSSATLYYSVDGGSETSVTLGAVYCGENTWGGEIPAQAVESVVEFYITAMDGDANSTSSATLSYTVMNSSGQTIYEIQHTSTVSGDCYDSPLNGQTVTFSGIITASGSDNYYIQDGAGAWNGVYVYDNTNSAVRGDSVTMVADVDEFYGMTEIKNISSYTVNSSDNPEPEPVVVNTGDLGGGCSINGEAYEGVLVKLENVTVTAAADQYGQWLVDDGTGACEVEDKYFEHEPSVGDVIPSLVGVVEYGFSEYAVCPRDANDFGAPATFDNSATSPDFITSTSEITVSIDIMPSDDTQTINFANIKYGTDGTFLNTGEMWLDSGDNWQGVIPAQAGNSLLAYKVEAVTSANDTVYSYAYELPVASSTLTDISTIQANPVEGEIHTIEGVITIGSGLLQTGLTNAYIQDASGRGMNLFNYDTTGLKRGDKIKAVGEIEIYYTTIELKNFSYELISTGNNLPDPVLLTSAEANAAIWEGTLIQIWGEITKVDPSDDGSGTSYMISDGTDTSEVRIWKSTNVNTTGLTQGSSWTFVGVESQYFNEFQLLVAYDEDIMDATSIDPEAVVIPQAFGLNPVYPNPFNPSTTVSWTLDQTSDVDLTVYDVMGREVAVLMSGTMEARTHQLTWDASNLSSGVYFVQLTTPAGVDIQKVMLLK